MKTLALLLFACAVSVWGQTVAEPIPVANQQFLDCRTGACLPLNGGKLFSYNAGTLTPKVTYTDSTGTTPNANPVILNSSGFNAAGSGNSGVWIRNACYKFILKDLANVVLWTQDNVCNQAALYATALATSTGAGTVGFSQTATYSAGTVGKSLQRERSIKDAPYSAIGDGVTNDTTALQTAINAGIGTVYIPAGSYLLDAITMNTDVALKCAAGTTFKFNTDSEIMFNTGSNVNRAGIEGEGGYCYFDPNGHVLTQAVSIVGNPSSSTNNTYRNLETLGGVGIFVETQNTYFNLFENIRVFGPTVAAFEFEVATTATTCLNCSAIATTGAPYGFLIHNGGSISFNGTIEGTMVNSVYQADSVSFKVYFENTGSTNAAPWVQVGTQTGTFTQAISFDGCTFGTGAQYALSVEQVFGLTVRNSAISTTIAAFLIDNSGLANGTKRGLIFEANNYNIGGLGYDPTKIYAFVNAAAGQDLSYNISSDTPNPVKMIGTRRAGADVVPPDNSMNNGEGTIYQNTTDGILRYRYRDGAGVMQQGIPIGGKCAYLTDPSSVGTYAASCYADAATGGLDGSLITGYGGVRVATLSGTGSFIQLGGYYGGSYHSDAASIKAGSISASQAINFTTEAGANNALVATLVDTQGNNVTVAAGLRVTVKLGHTLQIGANTLNLNGSGAKAILKASNLTNLSVAQSIGSIIELIYDGASWQFLAN